MRQVSMRKGRRCKCGEWAGLKGAGCCADCYEWQLFLRMRDGCHCIKFGEGRAW